jgi:hypothetical protein
MTQEDLKKAVSLYKRYKTDGEAFRRIAEKYGISTADLTGKCWHAIRIWQSNRSAGVY